MDADEIRTLLGEMVFERAQKYRRRILQSSCTTNEDGVRHVSALVQGNGADCFYTQVWLRENGSFVSASCDCPYNQNGDGTYCKHIGALLLEDAAKHPAPKAPAAPESIPGVVRGTDGLNLAASRKDSYASGLEMLFGRKWRGDAPVTDQEARKLLETYQQSALQDLGEAGDPPQDTGFVELEPELTMLSGGQPWLRLRIANRERGRQYVVKSIPALLDDVEHGRSAGYGRFLTFVHRWDAFDEESRQLLQLLRRQVNAKQSMETNVVRSYSYAASDAPAGGLPLTGEIFDALVQLYAPTGTLGGPKLLFVTMQNVFSRMGGLGPIFGILFYLLVVFAAISSSISLLEAVVAHFVDKARDSGKGDKRKKYTLIAAAAVGVGCILICADSLGGADFTPWKFLGLPEADIRTWNDCWLDFFDMLSEGIMMPLGALLMSIMIGWELGPDVVKEECEQSGHPMSGYGFFKVIEDVGFRNWLIDFLHRFLE